MICPICHKRDAETVVSKRVGGAVIQGEVCEDCHSAAESLSESDFRYLFLDRPNKRCGCCGRSLGQIESTMIVGCEYCYDAFRAELEPLIEILQSGKRYD